MTVEVTTTISRSPANGVTRDFNFAFKIFADDDIVVRDIVDATGVATIKTLTTHYTVTRSNTGEGGFISFVSIPASGHTIDIRSLIELQQPTSIKNQGTFHPELHEGVFDRLERQGQDTRRLVDGAIKIPDYEVARDMSLPVDIAGKFLAFDANRLPIGASGTGNDSALRTDLASTIATQDGTRLIGFRRTESGSAAEAVYDILRRQVRLVSFGADPTGVADCKAAFDAAIAACVANNHSTLLVDHGMYRFASAPAAISYGIKILCPGSQGSTEPYGTVFKIDFSGTDFLTWDGNGADFRGTGGGLENCLILIADTRSPNVGIKLFATNDNRRPGEMTFRNVLMFGTGSGSFSEAIQIDGRNCNTAGARGVRTVHFDKVRVASCRSDNKYIWLRQPTHVYGNVQMDTGAGTGILGMTIDDYWDHIHLSCRVGNIIVNYTGADNPTLGLHGECDTLDINDTKIIGSCSIKATSGITCAGKLVAISSWIADRFLANRTANVVNATGDATVYTIVYDGEIFDRNGTFDPATGIATIKCGGLYQFNWGVTLANLGAAHTGAELLLLHKDSGGGVIASYSNIVNPGAIRNAANQCALHDSEIIECSEGDTLRVSIMVSGSTKTVTVIGSTTRYTRFSGKVLA